MASGRCYPGYDRLDGVVLATVGYVDGWWLELLWKVFRGLRSLVLRHRRCCILDDGSGDGVLGRWIARDVCSCAGEVVCGICEEI